MGSAADSLMRPKSLTHSLDPPPPSPSPSPSLWLLQYQDWSAFLLFRANEKGGGRTEYASREERGREGRGEEWKMETEEEQEVEEEGCMRVIERAMDRSHGMALARARLRLRTLSGSVVRSSRRLSSPSSGLSGRRAIRQARKGGEELKIVTPSTSTPPQ